jgi:hypothetical protein
MIYIIDRLWWIILKKVITKRSYDNELCKKGKYRFRNVGANAEGKVKISVNSNSDVIITKDKKQ